LQALTKLDTHRNYGKRSSVIRLPGRTLLLAASRTGGQWMQSERNSDLVYTILLSVIVVVVVVVIRHPRQRRALSNL
jgi:membrane protein DedA with SNARE-associated domain